MVKFFIPNFYENFKLHLFLIDYMRERPFYFRDNIEIGAVYGTFPGAIWNGGRPKPGNIPSEEDWDYFQEIIWEYNSRGIPVRFTWTNCLLKEEHFDDPMCNRIMQIAHNGRNEVLVSNPELEKFLKQKYPYYKYIASITKCVQNEEEFLKMLNCDNYYMAVLDWRNNRNYEYLKSIPESLKHKIEFLVNSRCFGDCPNLKSHYAIMSKLQLENRHIAPTDPYFGCKASWGNFYEMLKVKPLMISADEIYDLYNKELGFINFKIEGRTFSPPEIIEEMVYYMVKPEYQNKIRLILLNYIW